MIKSKAGGEFKSEVLDEDVRTLIATKQFLDVQVQKQEMPGNKIRLYFIMKEYPSTITDVIYQGNKHLKPEELETITGLRKGGPLNPIAVRMGQQAILRRYNDMGRMLTGVEILEGDKLGDRRVIYKITEGQIARVKSTNFVGSSFVTAVRFRSHLLSLRPTLDLSDNYDPEQVEQDVHRLEAYLQNFGFHDAQVRRELIWSDNRREVEIVFHIEEGVRYRVSGVHLTGKRIKEEEKLEADLQLKQGDYYVRSNASADQRLIQERYGQEGISVVVEERKSFTGPGQVAVVYEITPANIQESPKKAVAIKVIGEDVPGVRTIFRTFEIQNGVPVCIGQSIDSENSATRDLVLRRQAVPAIPAPFPIP
jgi:outer membrane protein insertion porin family